MWRLCHQRVFGESPPPDWSTATVRRLCRRSELKAARWVEAHPQVGRRAQCVPYMCRGEDMSGSPCVCGAASPPEHSTHPAPGETASVVVCVSHAGSSGGTGSGRNTAGNDFAAWQGTHSAGVTDSAGAAAAHQLFTLASPHIPLLDGGPLGFRPRPWVLQVQGHSRWMTPR